MTKHAHLNNVEHRDLRVITGRGARFGEDVMYTLTFPAEFRNVQAHFPIVFGKSNDGTFTPLALFGFREKQNLFLDGDKWDALYVPLMMERQPFLIGQAPPQNNRFFVVRGDEAQGLTADQAADSLHWYIWNWRDESPPVKPSGDFGTSQVGQDGSPNTTWGAAKALYR